MPIAHPWLSSGLRKEFNFRNGLLSGMTSNSCLHYTTLITLHTHTLHVSIYYPQPSSLTILSVDNYSGFPSTCWIKCQNLTLHSPHKSQWAMSVLFNVYAAAALFFFIESNLAAVFKYSAWSFFGPYWLVWWNCFVECKLEKNTWPRASFETKLAIHILGFETEWV